MEIKRLNQMNDSYANQLKNIRDLNINDEYGKKFINNPNNIAFIAVENKQVIGFAWGYVLERMDTEGMIYIHSIDVVEEYRSKGVGTSLMQAFIDIVNTNHYRNAFIITDGDNIAANHLYQKFEHKLEQHKNLYIF